MAVSFKEEFTDVFERVILPLAKKLVDDDYERFKRDSVDGYDEKDELYFANLETAFEQRLKLYYFQKYINMKRKGEEREFPGSTDDIKRDVNLMYSEFKSFLSRPVGKYED